MSSQYIVDKDFRFKKEKASVWTVIRRILMFFVATISLAIVYYILFVPKVLHKFLISIAFSIDFSLYFFDYKLFSSSFESGKVSFITDSAMLIILSF